MKSHCEKKSVTLVWCMLECLLLSGLINGWIFLTEILKEEDYYTSICNKPMLREASHSSNGRQSITLNNSQRRVNGNNNNQSDEKKKCFYKKVYRTISVDDYNKLKLKKLSENVSSVQTDTLQNSTFNSSCPKQNERLELIFFVITHIRDILILPAGIMFDKYGTSKTRIIAMCCTAFGSLTMLFSSNAYPWLILPALLMLGLSGFLILLTDLQVSNLFGSRRYTVMSVFVGAYFSGGIVIFFMKLTKSTGVTLQTSFMFTTIGIVPVLISTIAMLPKSRIPWPLPAEYGTNRRVNYAEDKNAKTKAWQRRTSVDSKKKGDLSEFWGTIRTKLYILSAIWFSLLNLKIWLFDVTVDFQLKNLGLSDTPRYISLYALILLFSLPMSPLIGIIMDWNKTQVAVQHHVVQMRNILTAVCVQFCIAILSSVASLFSNTYVQVLSFILVAMEKVTLHATLFAFLTHVHFPSEHLGKLVGVVISLSGVTLILQFPLKILIQQGVSENTFYIHIILVVMVLVSGCHPLSLWYHCRTGGIKNRADIAEQERPLTVILMERMVKNREQTETDNAKDNGVGDKQDDETTKLHITDL